MEEEVPENLGHEWRVLHPFEIPGVRFPTDNTPPNQRRLAENDALVELIQTTEYLEDTPMWGQRDYQFYPLGMVTLFIEEEEGAEEEVEEEENGWARDCLKEKQSKGLGEVLPMEMEGEMKEDSIPRPFGNKSGDRQEEEWSSPASDGRGRRDVLVSSDAVQESQQRTPPTPAPSEDRFFTDWSSIRTGSPLVRMPPQSILVRERWQEINQTTIQTSQPGPEPTQMVVTENTFRKVSLVLLLWPDDSHLTD